MRRLGEFALLVAATWQLGCGQTGEESRHATDALRQRCAKSGTRIEPAPSIRAIVENEGDRDGRHFVGIRFEVLFGTRATPDLAFGSVGVGNSAEDARSTATQEWVLLFAEPYCAARANTGEGIRLGTFVVYPSALGLRGEHPGGWLKDDRTRNQRILDAAGPDLAPRGLGEIGVIDLKVVVQNDRHATGECRINALPNTAACERITSLPWPVGTYMYKQAFVYRAAPP